MRRRRRSNALTPATFSLKQQSAYGIASAPAIRFDQTTIFISRAAGSVREFVYDNLQAQLLVGRAHLHGPRLHPQPGRHRRRDGDRLRPGGARHHHQLRRHACRALQGAQGERRRLDAVDHAGRLHPPGRRRAARDLGDRRPLQPALRRLAARPRGVRRQLPARLCQELRHAGRHDDHDLQLPRPRQFAGRLPLGRSLSRPLPGRRRRHHRPADRHAVRSRPASPSSHASCRWSRKCRCPTA